MNDLYLSIVPLLVNVRLAVRHHDHAFAVQVLPKHGAQSFARPANPSALGIGFGSQFLHELTHVPEQHPVLGALAVAVSALQRTVQIQAEAPPRQPYRHEREDGRADREDAKGDKDQLARLGLSAIDVTEIVHQHDVRDWCLAILELECARVYRSSW